MKKQYPFIELHHPKQTMWKLIERKKMPPTRLMRYCCAVLKESSNVKGCFSLTGVRHAESVQRSTRGAFEILGKTSKDKILLNDNDMSRRETEYCMQKDAHMCNPIIDWSDDDVWHYIKGKGLPYCSLYDEGWKRLGCIGCPMKSEKEREKDFRMYPKFAECYKRAFQHIIDSYGDEWKGDWQTGEDMFNWWIYGEGEKRTEQDETLF